MSSTSNGALVRTYLVAKEVVLAAGFADEIDWQDDLSLDQIEERDFLREAAWVILSAGMRESVIRKRFDEISESFLGWESAASIVTNRDICRCRALSLFNHKGKIDAILEVAQHVVLTGYSCVRESLINFGVEYLNRFPFIGPVTCWHLAKNLGLNVVKPDRHLVRISKAVGFNSPLEMCRAIAESSGEKLAVIDIVLWRFATINSAYVETFRSASCDPSNAIGSNAAN